MNSAGKYAVVALSLAAIAGCADKTAKATLPPPQAQAPAIPAGKAGAMYPPPLTESQQPQEQPAPTPPPVEAKVEPTPPPQPAPTTKKPVVNHKPKPSPAKPTTPTEGAETPATTAQTPPTSATTQAPAEDAPQVAANGEPAPASPIGKLSTGDSFGQGPNRKDTVDLITNTESGLNAIKRPLNAEEQETANQIKTFLAKARAALTVDDLDGASTLAIKAKVLLDELIKT